MKYINSLATFRKSANISLHDVAYLINIDSGNLSSVEKGIRRPSLRIILLYHILFDAPVIKLLEDEFRYLKQLILKRSEKLIEQLKTEQPPKSNNRIQFIREFANNLNDPAYEL